MLPSRLISLLLLCLILGSCKKERVQWASVQQLQSHTSARLSRILFAGDSLAIVVGGDRFSETSILSSRDGGYNWQYLSYTASGKALYDICSAPDGSIYAAGFDGKLLHSGDSGDNWQLQQLLYWDPLKTLAFPTAHHGILAGGVSFGVGYMMQVDGNLQLLRRDSLTFEVNMIRMADSLTGYLAGYGAVQKTTDGGNSWQWLNLNGDNFTALHLDGPGRIWICGYEGSIWHSADGGQRWQRQRRVNSPTGTKHRWYDILFTDDQHGFVAGESGHMMRTRDGGNSWEEMERFTGQHLRDLAACPNGDLLVCGENGALYRLRIP